MIAWRAVLRHQRQEIRQQCGPQEPRLLCTRVLERQRPLGLETDDAEPPLVGPAVGVYLGEAVRFGQEAAAPCAPAAGGRFT